ncbi:MAG: tetratricopeptide repeat protein [Chloroflexota bacterium]
MKPTDSVEVTRQTVRAVFKSWQNSKKVGSFPLAAMAIVEVRRRQEGYDETPAGRGLALKTLLTEAMNHLWLDGDSDSPTDAQLTFFTILNEQYINGRQSKAVYDELDLSEASYFEKQGQALDLIASTLSEWEAMRHQSDDKLPPSSSSPPDVTHFIGRAAELAYFRQKLAELNYVVITGFPGMGKTDLAAKLVRTVAAPKDIFWHKCRVADSADNLIWQLASFLGSHGHLELWTHLKDDGQREKSSMPFGQQIDLAIHLLSTNGYLVCLDNFQHVDEEPAFCQVAERLYEATQSVQLRLIITSHRTPAFMRQIFEPLNGMSKEDVAHLLIDREVELQEEALDLLYAKTGGHSLAVTLAIPLLKESSRVDRLLRYLIETDEIEHFLLNAVDKHLAPEERAVMSCVALLGDRGGSRGAIEATLDGGSVLSPLRTLYERNLLSVVLGDEGREYSQHALVQKFYYDNLGKRERQAMHKRAGAYYEEESDRLRAANHLLDAEAYEEAAELLTQDIYKLLNQGQAGQLRQLLERFEEEQVEPRLWLQIQIALGQLYTFLPQNELALGCFEAVLARFDEVPNSEEILGLKYETYRGLGYLLRSSQPADALTWLEKGLAEVADENPLWTADLLIQKGIALRKMQRGNEALNALNQGLELLPVTDSQKREPVADRLRLLGLMNLGVSTYYQNELAQSQTYLEQALAQANKLDDTYNQLDIQNNLAVLQQISGHWAEAIQNYEEAIALAEPFGYQTLMLINSGVLYRQLGEYPKAAQHLEEAIDLTRQARKHDQLVTALAHYAEVQLSQDELDLASQTLTKAEQLSLDSQIEYQLPLIYRLRSLYYLKSGDAAVALKEIERSLEIIDKVKMQADLGPSLRVLGQVQSALGENQEAEKNFALSLEELTGNPYEEALTQVAWARHQLAQSNEEGARNLLNLAKNTFQWLEAAQDLVIVNVLLAQLDEDE